VSVIDFWAMSLTTSTLPAAATGATFAVQQLPFNVILASPP